MTEYNIDNRVDDILQGSPEALKKRKVNRKFIKNIQENQVTAEAAEIPVFGVKSVNVNAILKDNIWNRSIFTTDKLCRMHRGMTYEKLKKYQRKKRSVPFPMMWIIILMFVVAVVILVVLFLLPKLGVVI